MNALDALWHDVVFTMRLLRTSPVFAGAIVLTLALGIGVNTTIFSVVNGLILRPLPVRDGNRLVVIATQDASGQGLGSVSFPDLQDYRGAASDVLEDIAGYRVGFLGLAREGGRAERVLVTWITGNYFPLLDIAPAHGRLIRPEEGGPSRADAVVVLGYSTWQRRFRGDPAVVGTVVRVNGQPCTIVGVVPEDFVGTFAFSDAELYLPLNWDGHEDFDDRQARGLHALARLRPGGSIEKAEAAMNVVADRLARQYPDSNANVRVRVLPEGLARPVEDQFRANALGARIMLGMVVLVMIVATVNVANLLLARAIGRRHEVAIRSALGAGRRRLVQQMVTECTVFAMLGGIAGAILGLSAARILASISLPGDLPVRFDFELDGRVLVYVASVTLISGLLVGLLPALRASGVDVSRALRLSRPASPGIRSGRARGLLVVAQIALSFVLLVAAGLFVRSLFNAERADLGFRPDGVLNVHLDVGQLGYTEAQGRAFFDEVDRRVRAIPGVQTVSSALTVPMGYVFGTGGIEAEGRPADRNTRVSAGSNVVSPDYFTTMGIRLIRGRSFNGDDDERTRPVAVVNERLAETLWPGRDPIGQRFRADGPTWLEVVGVTATGKYQFLFEDPLPYFYVPVAQEYTGLRVLQIRTSQDPETLAPAVEQVIRAQEPDLPLYDVQSMKRALGSGLGFFPMRAGAAAIAALGLLAFLLAIVGLYGVVSHIAAQRTHEIGLRIAVGASRRDVVRLVLADGLSLVVRGLAAGLLIALLTSQVAATFLFRVSPRDPLTLLGVAAMLGGVAVLACLIPAWRATRLDPTMALRAE